MASNDRVSELCRELQGLKTAVTELSVKMDAMVESLSVMEKTVRMVLIANWDQLEAFRGQRRPEFLLLRGREVVVRLHLCGVYPQSALCKRFHTL